MKSKIILRGAFGIPSGISVGYLITIFSSLFWGQGSYSPCVPEFIDLMGSELAAVILQTVFCAVLGVVFAAGSVIWDMETWSIARQTGLYFLITSAAMIPISYFLRWMEHSAIGFLTYFGAYVFIFILIWFVQYIVIKRNIKRMNAKLN